MKDVNTEKKPVPGYEGCYSVTSNGEVISEKRAFTVMRKGTAMEVLKKERTLKGVKNPDGYSIVRLYKDGISKPHKVHRLVAKAFLPPPEFPDQNEVRHKEGDPSKNTKYDLEWGTRADNQKDRERHGTKCIGEKNPSAKSAENDILQIRARVAAGETMTSVANDFNMSKANVSAIFNNKIWKHLK